MIPNLTPQLTFFGFLRTYEGSKGRSGRTIRHSAPPIGVVFVFNRISLPRNGSRRAGSPFYGNLGSSPPGDNLNTTSLTLLEAVRQNDRAAWMKFLTIYSGMLQSWARGIGLDEGDAEDVSQEVLAVVAVKLPEFTYEPGKRGFRAWLKTVARRKAIDVKRRKRDVVSDTAVSNAFDLDESALDNSFDAEHNRHLVFSILASIKAHFSETHWNVFWDMTYGQHTAKEVAIKHGVSDAHAFVIKSRVIKQLRKELKDFLE